MIKTCKKKRKSKLVKSVAKNLKELIYSNWDVHMEVFFSSYCLISLKVSKLFLNFYVASMEGRKIIYCSHLNLDLKIF